MNPSVLLYAHLPANIWKWQTCRITSGEKKTKHYLFSPEVVQELGEGVDSPCQRHNDVDDHRRRLHGRAPDLHERTKGPEERDVAKTAGLLFGEEELVERTLVSLSPVQP